MNTGLPDRSISMEERSVLMEVNSQRNELIRLNDNKVAYNLKKMNELVKSSTGDLIEGGAWGANDRRVEVWTGNHWQPTWWSKILPGWMFRFLDNSILPEDKCFKARTSTQWSFMPSDTKRTNPSFVMGVVEVLQAPSRDTREPLGAQIQTPKTLRKPNPKYLSYAPDDITDV